MVRELIDTFLWNGEEDVLKLRMDILGDIVDQFIPIEGNLTFQGDLRTPIGNYVVELPVDVSSWEREYIQRAHHVDVPYNSIVMMGDVDEIPDPKVLKWLLTRFDEDQIYALEQDWYINYLNVRNATKPIFVGTRISSSMVYGDLNAKQIRHSQKKQVVKGAGWHFSFIGGVTEVQRKIQSYSYTHYNTPEVLDNVPTCLENNLHPLSLDWGYNLITVHPSKTWHPDIGHYEYPDFVVQNQTELQHLIRSVS